MGFMFLDNGRNQSIRVKFQLVIKAHTRRLTRSNLANPDESTRKNQLSQRACGKSPAAERSPASRNLRSLHAAKTQSAMPGRKNPMVLGVYTHFMDSNQNSTAADVT